MTYLVGRGRMKVGSEFRFEGDPIPEAAEFPNLARLLRSGYIAYIPDGNETPPVGLSHVPRSTLHGVSEPGNDRKVAKVSAMRRELVEKGLTISEGAFKRMSLDLLEALWAYIVRDDSEHIVKERTNYTQDEASDKLAALEGEVDAPEAETRPALDVFLDEMGVSADRFDYLAAGRADLRKAIILLGGDPPDGRVSKKKHIDSFLAQMEMCGIRPLAIA